MYPAFCFTFMTPGPIIAKQTAIRQLALLESTHWIVLHEDLLASLYHLLPFKETTNTVAISDDLFCLQFWSDREIELHKKFLVL